MQAAYCMKMAVSESDDNPNIYTVEEFETIFEKISSFTDIDRLMNDEEFPSWISSIKDFLLSKNPDMEIINLDLKYHVSRVICELLHFLYKKIDALYSSGEKSTAEKDSVFGHLLNLIQIVLNFTNYSAKVAENFYDADVLKYLFDFINLKPLLADFRKSSKEDNVATELMLVLFGAVSNLSAFHGKFEQKWKELNAVCCLLEMLDLLAEMKSICQMSIYMTLANIADDREIEKLPRIKEVIPCIARFFELIANSIESQTDLNRVNVVLDYENYLIYEVATAKIGLDVFHLIELVNCLYHLAVNDSIKYEIYHENKMNSLLNKIVLHGNCVEQEYALKLLWQLCFDDRVASDVCGDQALLSKINQLKDTSWSPKVKKNSDGILWLINNKFVTTRKCTDNKHIMISYNNQSRELCLRVKEDLERLNFKVWIDVESIRGSSLESMADAVENSMCVLMCMTEKYKMSPYCRAEAEYAFQLHKPIIPIKMETNYKPDGWLGIILGSKIYIDFVKLDYEEAMRRLKFEIKSYLTEAFPHRDSLIKEDDLKKKENENTTKETDKKSGGSKPEPLALSWSEKDVKHWLKEKKIHSKIVANVIPSNGQVLRQLVQIQSEAPEFFYKSISSKMAVPTRDVAIFAHELKNLFST